MRASLASGIVGLDILATHRAPQTHRPSGEAGAAAFENASTQKGEPSRKPWRLLRVRTETARAAARVPEAARVRTAGRRVGQGGTEPVPAEVLALRYELGRLHSLGLLQALILSLRIADGFCQHLA